MRKLLYLSVLFTFISCLPTPTPTPTPPPPTPIPPPPPTTVPPVSVTVCPKTLAPGAYAYVNNKPYGQGFDSAYRVHGDAAFCAAIHGIAVDDCNIEGWPARVACELELGNGCPIWQYSIDEGKTVKRCSDNQSANISCDHFGDPTYRDDPKTPTTGDSLSTLVGFEGMPKECGLQRDSHGPLAGFFTIAHGKGLVRACLPDNSNCGPWQGVDH